MEKNLKQWMRAAGMGIMLSAATCGAAFASLDSDILAIEQKRADVVVAGLLGANPSASAAQNVANVFAADQAKAFTPAVYKTLRADCVARFGKKISTKLVSFQRQDQSDVLVYRGSFEKEKILFLGFTFDKNAKLLNFTFNPPEPPKATKGDKGKKKKK